MGIHVSNQFSFMQLYLYSAVYKRIVALTHIVLVVVRTTQEQRGKEKLLFSFSMTQVRGLDLLFELPLLKIY